ncbi:MAG: penicillin-binding transpeptidase domain-containing protein [Clostridiales bacterium]|nr:penicillin-binding transpeptidase domain-containing protein [Clostridiales bacterium]
MIWYKSRNNILLIVFCALFALLSFRLFQITGPEGEHWTLAAAENTVRTVSTSAPRGNIYDRNGVLLAGSHPVFAVEFSRGGMPAREVNESLRKVFRVLNKNEEAYIDDFPIRIDMDGSYYYQQTRDLNEWRARWELPEGFPASLAYSEIRRRYEIPPGLDNYEASQELYDRYGVTVPIILSNMEYTRDAERRQFLEAFGLPAYTSARDAFMAIREYYGLDDMIPKPSHLEAHKIITVRYRLALQAFMRYLPVEIAAEVGKGTVVEVEENLHNMEGVSVLPKSRRFYPLGEAASHVIGYMGKIPATEAGHYVNELGYRASDLVGQYGMERSLEDVLRGTYGGRTIQIDSTGRIIKVLGEETVARRGQDVALTIDIEYQQRVKENLLRGLEAVQTAGVYESRFGDYKAPRRHPGAIVGTAVVLNAKTGEPLAIVNSEDFDPNVFAGGITPEDWEALQPQNPRDPLSPRPLYNWATSASVQPGSTFKPLIAIAGLEHGLDPNRTIFDPRSMRVGGQVFSCLSAHGAVNLYTAMQTSCNFYFYGAGCGRDWARGASLGYAEDITIDGITDYAKQFGLGVRSDIEIEESVVPAPTSETKLRGTEGMLRAWLIGQSEEIFTEHALQNKANVLEAIDEIASWTAENPSLSDMTGRMVRLGVREDEARVVAEECKFTYYNYASWSITDQMNISIGQGENAYTPLQMAHYMATMVTDGMRNSLSLVKATEDGGLAVRPAGEQADVNPENLEHVREAMRRAVTGGTLFIFNRLPVTSIGKTGTAEREGRVNPPDEVAYMQEHLGAINPVLDWGDVMAETERLMREFPSVYVTENTAVRRAVLNLSDSSFDSARLDMFKAEYDHFSWVVAAAPAEDPEIAIALLVPQGGLSSSVVMIAREMVGDWFDLKDARAAAGIRDMNWTSFFELNNEERERHSERVMAIKPEDAPRLQEEREREREREERR